MFHVLQDACDPDVKYFKYRYLVFPFQCEVTFKWSLFILCLPGLDQNACMLLHLENAQLGIQSVDRATERKHEIQRINTFYQGLYEKVCYFFHLRLWQIVCNSVPTMQHGSPSAQFAYPLFYPVGCENETLPTVSTLVTL